MKTFGHSPCCFRSIVLKAKSKVIPAVRYKKFKWFKASEEAKYMHVPKGHERSGMVTTPSMTRCET